MTKEVYKCWAIDFISRGEATEIEVDTSLINQHVGTRAAASLYAEQFFSAKNECTVKTLSIPADGDSHDTASLIYLQCDRQGKVRYIDVGVINSAGSEWGYRVTIDGPSSAFYAGISLW